MDLTAFAAAVVAEPGPVTVGGLGTRGGAVDGARAVHAPAGVGTFLAEEMTVECGAGTPVDELSAEVAAKGQFVALPAGGTVGGALAVGHGGLLRLGHCPVRDTLLQCEIVLADGAVVKAGGPTVKNVSGFDLCRLFVGAQGTLGFFGSVLLRTRPLPAVRSWFSTDAATPTEVRRALFRPSAVLWDGTTTWVCLEGHADDVADQASMARLTPVDGPPPVPAGARWVASPAQLAAWRASSEGPFLAEIGVGVVHTARPAPPAPPTDAAVITLATRVKRQFDPDGRMNPGRAPAGVEAAAARS
jgi:FAD/FMN-containing dehydrogenase